MGAVGRRKAKKKSHFRIRCIPSERTKTEIKKIGREKKKMNGTKKLAALVVVCIMVAAVGVPIAIGDEAGSATTTVEVQIDQSPVITSVTIKEGNIVDLSAGAATDVPVVVAVTHDNGQVQITSVAVTGIDPTIDGAVYGVLGTREIIDATHARFSGTISLPCTTAPKTGGGPNNKYTLAVTATDAALHTGDGSGDFQVNELVAISVSNVAFGIVCPGGAEGTGSSTVQNEGNVNIKFAEADGITWIKMTSTQTTTDIPADAITTSWTENDEINKGSSGNVPFGLLVPVGTVAADDYTGTIVFTAST